MAKNYFAIERSGKCIDHLHIKQDDGAIAFEDVMNMSYEELTVYEYIDTFVTAVMDATNDAIGGKDENTVVTLIDENDVFVWSVLIGAGDYEDELRYGFINWRESGKKYRYEK